MTERLKDVAAETVDGKDCVVVIGENGARIAIPAEQMGTVVSVARQRMNAHLNASAAPVAGWQNRYLVPVSSARVDQLVTRDNRTVALTLDPGEKTEQTLALSPTISRVLGHSLIEAASRESLGSSSSQ